MMFMLVRLSGYSPSLQYWCISVSLTTTIFSTGPSGWLVFQNSLLHRELAARWSVLWI